VRRRDVARVERAVEECRPSEVGEVPAGVTGRGFLGRVQQQRRSVVRAGRPVAVADDPEPAELGVLWPSAGPTLSNQSSTPADPAAGPPGDPARPARLPTSSGAAGRSRGRAAPRAAAEQHEQQRRRPAREPPAHLVRDEAPERVARYSAQARKLSTQVPPCDASTAGMGRGLLGPRAWKRITGGRAPASVGTRTCPPPPATHTNGAGPPVRSSKSATRSAADARDARPEARRRGGAQLEVDPEVLVDRALELDRGERVTAVIEEVVVEAVLVDAEDPPKSARWSRHRSPNRLADRRRCRRRDGRAGRTGGSDTDELATRAAACRA
jgi:hypothetical protein